MPEQAPFDSAKTDSMKRRAAALSLLAALFLTAFKLAVGLYTNSLAILSEALHSGLDLVAAVMTWYAVFLSSRPADSGHPYGHGRAENLSALAETVLLFAVCIYVGWEGMHRLMEGGEPVLPSLWGVGVMAVSMLVDASRVRALRKAARAAKSQALEADALHFATDIFASAVVFVGVLAVWLADWLHAPAHLRHILAQADTVAALIVALVIFKASRDMARSAVGFLMDAGSAETQRAVEEAVRALPGVLEVSRLRMRSSGPRCFFDMNLGVEPNLRVSEGHRIAHEAACAVKRLVPGADVVVHVDPCAPGGASASPLEACRALALRQGLSAHDFRIFQTGSGRPRIEAVLEFDGGIAYARAMARVRAYEAAVARLHPDVELVTHVEPAAQSLAASELAPGESSLADACREQVERAVARHPLCGRPHGIAVLMEPGLGLCLGFHCTMGGVLSVCQVHDETVRLEQELREALPVLARVTVHVDCAEDMRDGPDACGPDASGPNACGPDGRLPEGRSQAQDGDGETPSTPRADSGPSACPESSLS